MKIFQGIIVIIAFIKFIACEETNFRISINQTLHHQIKFFTQNHTIGFEVDWGLVEQTNFENQLTELVIEANATRFPSQQYQIPFLCLNNHTATRIQKQYDIIAPKILASQCDFYSFRTNQGQYRFILQSQSWFQNTQYFLSFFNITSLQNLTLEQFQKIPFGDIHLDNNGTLEEDNYWTLDLNIGLYQISTKQFDCNSRGVYNLTYQTCTCEQGYGGVYCEFQITELASETTQIDVIEPYKFKTYKFNFDNFYNLVLESNNTLTFNFFFCDQEDSDEHLQAMFIQTFQRQSFKIQHKNKQQILPLPYNETISCIYFWFKNENSQQLNLELTMKPGTHTFYELFIQTLVSYLFYTLLGSIFFCTCSFGIAYVSSCIYKKYLMFTRQRSMNKQLPLMTFQEFKQNQRLQRNDQQPTCSVCLCDYQDQEIVRVTQCHHVYHQECIEEWALKNNKCPICREKIFPIFNSTFLQLLIERIDRRNNAQNAHVGSEQNIIENQNHNPNEIQLSNVQAQNTNPSAGQINQQGYQNLIETH